MRSLQTGLPLTREDVYILRALFREDSKRKLAEVMEYIKTNYPEVWEWMEERGLTDPCCLLDLESVIDILIDIIFREPGDDLYYEAEILEIERDGETIEIPIVHTWIATIGEDKLIIVLPEMTVGLMF